MQVNHVQDHVTHAVIAAGQAIDFGISDDPEFFNILSSTLYSDQKLAVVRETLCNAWDAHIEGTVSDRYVDVTLDDKHFILRDYGLGISKKMIGPVYGMYGGSTKVKNGKVTGGFGLGCKSPFAYVDDFQVTSYHDGERTIYRLSKSNAEVGGKPSIIPIVSTPTKESGLEVKIAIKNAEDKRRFEVLIRRIVQNGAMKVKLNGIELTTLPFDDMHNGFMLTKAQVLENHQPIVIRYGNVIYPIENDPTYSTQWAAIEQFINRLANGNNHYGRGSRSFTLVLQAEPNTVSVTPSRESLSLQKRTLATIEGLMNGFLANKEKTLKVECFKLLNERIESTMLDATPKVLFDPTSRMPNMYRQRVNEYGDILRGYDDTYIYNLEDNLTDFPQFVKQYSHSSYPDFPGFRKHDIMTRINSLIQSGFGGKEGARILKSYRRAYEIEQHVGRKYGQTKARRNQIIESPWFPQHVLWPLMKKLNASGLNADKLFVYGGRSRYRLERDKIIPAKSYSPQNLEAMLPFARNIVILSFNKLDILDGAADKQALTKFWLGDAEKSLVYVVPRADPKVEQAREFFKASGVHLIDLTIAQQKRYADNLAIERSNPSVVVPKKPKKTGIPKLSAMVTATGGYYNRAIDNLEIERTAAPEFILKDGRRNEYLEIEGLDGATSRAVIELYGDKGAVCVNQNQYDRYRNAGAMDWQEWILDRLLVEYETNPRIQEYLAYDYTRIEAERYGRNGYYGCLPWVKIIVKDRDFFEYFGLVDNRTDDDKKIMRIYRSFNRNYIHGKDNQRLKIMKVIENVKMKPTTENLFKRLKAAKLLHCMDESFCRQAITESDTYGWSAHHQALARDLLLRAIEG